MEFLLQLLSPTEWVLLIVTGLLGWTIYGIIYRFYLHPLARFPGPKLAIATYWYEFYYDIFQDGQYTWKLRGLHEKYGEPRKRVDVERKRRDGRLTRNGG